MHHNIGLNMMGVSTIKESKAINKVLSLFSKALGTNIEFEKYQVFFFSMALSI
jgi:hypothetical protein